MLTELATRMNPAVSVLSDPATIAVLGLSYVGLPVALTCVQAGCRVLGIDSDPERVRVLREDGVDGPEADVGEARRLLGFEPVVPFDAGIRRTVAWFQAQRTEVPRAS